MRVTRAALVVGWLPLVGLGRAASAQEAEPMPPRPAATAGRMTALPVWIEDAERFPQYAQPDDISCGPTCCSMLLGYYGIDADVEAMKAAAGTRWFALGGQELGLTFPRSIERALEEYGVAVGVYHGRLEHVRQFVDENRPPILLVRSGPWMWHYIVVIGYGEQEGEAGIYYVDPGSGRTHWAPDGAIECGWCFDGDYLGHEIAGPICEVCAGCGEIGLDVDEDGDGAEDRCECTACEGEGRLPDLARRMVERFVSRRTLIVPEEGGR